MPEYLETTVDKFIFRVATDRLYSPDGIWVLWLEPQKKGQVRIGITDYLQQRNGDIAFVQVYPLGAKIAAGGVFAEIETIKAYVSIYSPVAGEIIEINPALELTPELVNQDPYGEGWLAVIETTNWEADRARLMDPQAYLSVMRSQAEEELNKS